MHQVSLVMVRVRPAPSVAETTLPPPDVSDTLEKVHPSISASAVEVMEISGDEMVATDEGRRGIWVSINEPDMAKKSECSSATASAT